MITAEKLQHRIKRLKTVHRDLDKKINQDYNKYMDDATVTDEKRERLRLKTEIQRLQQQLSTL